VDRRYATHKLARQAVTKLNGHQFKGQKLTVVLQTRVGKAEKVKKGGKKEAPSLAL
jgi:hypothetical protein